MGRIHSVCIFLLVLSSLTSVDAVGTFWQIGDFHYDHTYLTTGASCPEDLPADERGEYGNFLCDPPWKLVQESVEAMVKLIEGSQTPEFIIWQGDNVLHPVDYSILNQEMVLEIHQNITTLFQTKLPNIQVYAMIGNHDYYPKNQLPGENNEQYDAIAEMWSDWLDEEAKETFKKGAYYTQLVNNRTDLRVVVLNTNLYSTANTVTQGQEDPGNQFEWMETVLAQAEADGHKVHIILHIPSGYRAPEKDETYFTASANIRFNNIVRRYADIVLGLYSAHEHTDTFQLFYNQTQPLATMFIAPAITPYAGVRVLEGVIPRNPSLRCYTFDESSGQLLDIEQYFLDLDKANDGSEVEWKLEYKFSESYEIQDLKPETMNTVLDEFKRDDSIYFDKYVKYVYVTMDDYDCDDCCKQHNLCAIEFVDKDQYDACFKDNPLSCDATHTLLPLFSLLLAIILPLIYILIY